ncbi:MAG: hydroxyethylthiazole kinase [Gammaproteobacteria bacterium]|nr:hydroxyethylthiazole kinase [Gammaproteobacteria bacterium]
MTPIRLTTQIRTTAWRDAAKTLAAVRRTAPRVHCITNPVAMNLTANVLLALGATPTMSAAPSDVGAFVMAADALCINLGMMDGERRAAIDVAVQTALEHTRPWVLDPVLVEVSPERRDYALELCGRAPAVIRGNAAEVTALSEGGAAALANQSGAVIAQTGANDVLTSTTDCWRIGHDEPMLTKITGIGCAVSAVVAACVAVQSDAAIAAASALLIVTSAATRARPHAAGPGSLAVQFLDELHSLDPSTLSQSPVDP